MGGFGVGYSAPSINYSRYITVRKTYKTAREGRNSDMNVERFSILCSTLQSGGMASGDPSAALDAPVRPPALEDELRRNPQLKEEDVALLRDWASKQPHLPPLRDYELVQSLHLSNYSVERAKEVIDNILTARTHMPEFYAKRDQRFPELQNAVSSMLFSILPMATPEGYSVMIQCVMKSDVSIFNFPAVLKLFIMVLELWFLSGTSPGAVYIMDMKGLTLGHLLRMDVVSLKKFFALQDSFLQCAKGIHYINAAPFIDKLLELIKPFMKKELRNLVHVHTETSKTLFKYVPQNILPEEYGGSAPSVRTLHERMQSLLLANREYFLEEEQRRVDEQKRPGRPRSAEDLFGLEGTFKKLDID